MTRTLSSILAALACAALLFTACDSSGDGHDHDHGSDTAMDTSMDMDHTMMDWMVHGTLDPETPAVAQHTLDVHLMDADGEPITGATVTVDPQMPAHGHGSNEDPVVTETGDGHYEAFPVSFTMPGEWEVTVTCMHDGGMASQVFTYTVE